MEVSLGKPFSMTLIRLNHTNITNCGLIKGKLSRQHSSVLERPRGLHKVLSSILHSEELDLFTNLGASQAIY